MINQLEKEWQFDKSKSLVIGDSIVDKKWQKNQK